MVKNAFVYHVIAVGSELVEDVTESTREVRDPQSATRKTREHL